MRNWVGFIIIGPLLSLGLSLCLGAEASEPGHDELFRRSIVSILDRYCTKCHSAENKKGRTDLQTWPDLASVHAAKFTWVEVQQKLENEEMPPAPPFPDGAELLLLKNWVDDEVRLHALSQPQNESPIRRLNREEYNNTIRDLVGLDLRPADQFPSDDSSFGFDNNGGTLSVQQVLMERYLSAAGKVADAVIASGHPSYSSKACLAGEKRSDCLRKMISLLARRAYRRPVSPEEIQRLLSFAQTTAERDERDPEIAFRAVIEIILSSPNFLFRFEPNDGFGPKAFERPLSDFEYATRLSYLLWSSTPDDEMLSAAESGTLLKDLSTRVQKMLANPKSRAFVTNFFGQWLNIRDMDRLKLDVRNFPDFDHELRASMYQETISFISWLIREDRSLLELIDSKFTFVNERLSRHYQMPVVTGNEFRMVSVAQHRGGGILTQASILVSSSNPTRTSPVKRGRWIAENILGLTIAPPPANVPELEKTSQDSTHFTLRQQMEMHRQNPDCFSCHAKMDPIGLGLENFDATGIWREQEAGQTIDSSGMLFSGEAFNNADDLISLLQKRQVAFTRSLTTKLLIYALGRGLEKSERREVEAIVSRVRSQNYRFSSLILAVATHPLFRNKFRQNGRP